MDVQASLFGRKGANILPSPPESPSMYAYPPRPGEHGRYTTRLASRHALSTPSSSTNFRSAESARPENSLHDGRTSSRSSSLHQITTIENSSPTSSKMRAPQLPSPDEASDRPPREDILKQRPMRASSTASQPTPQLVLTEAEHQSEGDELFTGSEEEDEVAGGTEAVKSGAERLAEKRKMKRFRLTHAQTRYLMSEFSRQAHPDAAQRERLSRDIPGLNPRQVQVWFQNRRAKLKRLTSDDQERMRRSRALPEDFDFSQTLQPTFRDARPPYGPALTNPLMLEGGMTQRPSLRLGTGHTASHSMNSAFTNHAPSPVSAAGSANPSPVSSVNEGSERAGPSFSATQSPLETSPQFTNPFGRSYSMSACSSAFQRQGRPSSQSGGVGLGGQSNPTNSSSNPSLANNTYGHENLPPLQFNRNPFQTRDGQRFGRIQPTEGLSSHENGMAMNQNYLSPLSSPSTMSYDQSSQMLYPPGPGYRAPSYYQQSPNSNLWHGSQMNPQGYQYGQQQQYQPPPPPPPQTTEPRSGSQPSQSPFPLDPSIARYDQRSYSHSGPSYDNRMSSSAQEMSNESHARPQAGAKVGGEDRVAGPVETEAPLSEAAPPRARSDTFPSSSSSSYYNTPR